MIEENSKTEDDNHISKLYCCHVDDLFCVANEISFDIVSLSSEHVLFLESIVIVVILVLTKMAVLLQLIIYARTELQVVEPVTIEGRAVQLLPFALVFFELLGVYPTSPCDTKESPISYGG